MKTLLFGAVTDIQHLCYGTLFAYDGGLFVVIKGECDEDNGDIWALALEPVRSAGTIPPFHTTRFEPNTVVLPVVDSP